MSFCIIIIHGTVADGKLLRSGLDGGGGIDGKQVDT